MFSLTDAHFTGYMLNICRDIANRNPRFRQLLGQSSQISNNLLSFGDVQVIVKDVTSDGRRLSADLFIATQIGKAIVAKVAGKEGQFIAWASEVDPTGTLLDPGVYYINVDWVKDDSAPSPLVPSDAKTGEVGFTVQKYKWRQGRVSNATGSMVAFAPGIDATTVTPYDLISGESIPCSATQSSLQLLAPVLSLGVRNTTGTPLTPMTQYWIERETSQVLIAGTTFGVQEVSIPTNFLTISIVDQDGYTLRSGVDYRYLTSGHIQFSAWTQAGLTLSVTGLAKLNPTVAGNCIHPENVLNFQLLAGETLVSDQVFISTQDADRIQVTPNADGTVSLPAPLPTGGYCNYEVRILTGEYQAQGRRGSITQTLVPGLWIAMSDAVIAGDQCAILVSPVLTETYQVYGSQEGISCTIDVKANDLMTASDLASEIKTQLLVYRKLGMENDGVMVFEVSSSPQSGARDASGTAGTHTYSLGLSCAAEWREFRPLITRLTSFEITSNSLSPDRAGDITVTPRYQALGSTGFTPSYG